MKVYLAGPMRGIKAYNHPAFDRAAARLREEGHIVFSPAEHDREFMPEFDWLNLTGDPHLDGIPSKGLREAILTDLMWICEQADAMALLPGWQNSRGVSIEKPLADFIGLFIREIL